MDYRIRAFVCLALVAVGTGCAKAGSQDAALLVDGRTIALKLAFVEPQAPDLLAANNFAQLKAPAFDAQQQTLLLEQVNAVWGQCSIAFQADAPRKLELRSFSELRPDDATLETRQQALTRRIGRNGEPSRQWSGLFTSFSDLESHALHLAEKLATSPGAIPVLLVPDTASVFAGSNFGRTFGVVDDDYMRSLFDGNVKEGTQVRKIAKPLVIGFGYELHDQYFASQGEQSFGCAAPSQGPGSYFNVLAHELGHYLGLNHVLPKCNLMHNDSNLLTAEQCSAARKVAAAL